MYLTHKTESHTSSCTILCPLQLYLTVALFFCVCVCVCVCTCASILVCIEVTIQVYIWLCEYINVCALLCAGQSAISATQHTPTGSVELHTDRGASISDEGDMRAPPGWPEPLIFYSGVSQTIPADTLTQLDHKVSLHWTGQQAPPSKIQFINIVWEAVDASYLYCVRVFMYTYSSNMVICKA